MKCICCKRQDGELNAANAEAERVFGVRCSGGFEIDQEAEEFLCDACVLQLHEALVTRKVIPNG